MSVADAAVRICAAEPPHQYSPANILTVKFMYAISPVYSLALQEIPAQKSSKAKAFDFSRVTKIVSLPTKNVNLSQTALAPTALLTTKDFYSVKNKSEEIV